MHCDGTRGFSFHPTWVSCVPNQLCATALCVPNLPVPHPGPHPCCLCSWWQHLRPPFSVPCCSHHQVHLSGSRTHPQLFPKFWLFLTPILFCSGESVITQIIHPQKHELIPSFAESSFLCRSVQGSPAARACPAAWGHRDSLAWPGCQGWTWYPHPVFSSSGLQRLGTASPSWGRAPGEGTPSATISTIPG